MIHRPIAVALLSIAIFAGFDVVTAKAIKFEWTRQIGSNLRDLNAGISTDNLGSVYIAGTTDGILGPQSPGQSDAFVSRYDHNGVLLWTRQFGNNLDQTGSGVSADGLGNVYITGYTSGSLGPPSAGGADAFVAKYDDAGSQLWIRQFGSSAPDKAGAISADGLGNVYVTGTTDGNLGGSYFGRSDGFLSKYDDAGNQMWIRQIGGANDDYCLGVHADGYGNIYVSGFTFSVLDSTNKGNTDTFVAKYDDAGNQLWIRQFGSIYYETSRSITADALGNVYVTGEGYANVSDIAVSKLNAAGVLQWTKKLGTANQDVSTDVWADGLGNLYIVGFTEGSLSDPSAGDYDAFVAKYNENGVHQWTKQFGTVYEDIALGISGDGRGNIYLSGNTKGDIGGPNAGKDDVFIANFFDYDIISLPSDYNRDLTVDAADYAVWRDNVGSEAGALPNDVNGGVIGSAQYVTWKEYFGNSLGNDSVPESNSAVPEPSGIGLAIIVLVISARRIVSHFPERSELL